MGAGGFWLDFLAVDAEADLVVALVAGGGGVFGSEEAAALADARLRAFLDLFLVTIGTISQVWIDEPEEMK